MQKDIGRGIRKRREELGLSMRTVASAAGISPSMLSQVETGKLNPSVPTLYEIASYLDVSVDALMGLTPSDSGKEPQELIQDAVQRGSDNPTLELVDGVTWERLASRHPGTTEATLVTYEPGSTSTTEGRLSRHGGVEFGYLIEGQLSLQLGYEKTVLHAGDSFAFSGEVPHVFTNDSSAPARGLWVISDDFSEDETDAHTARFRETRLNVMNALRNSI